MTLETPLTRELGIEVPLICGAMYPCSNPELVAAVSEAGGIGIIQPMSIVFAHGLKFPEGLARIRALTAKPVGFNAIIEKTVAAYERQMRGWVEAALAGGVRFFITALGNPRWVVRLVDEVRGTVYHDVTERKWALKALDAGVKGLICVNNRAGGHAGPRAPEALIEEMGDLGVPLVCAGGVGDAPTFARMLALGYAGVQAGTRFIATTECTAHADYKQAIVRAREEEIGLTDKLSGVPCSIIKTPSVLKVGLRAGPVARRLLRYERTKRLMRMVYTLQSMWRLKRASAQGGSFKDYWQAGKSVAGIDRVLPVREVVATWAAAVDPSAHDGASRPPAS